MDTEQIVKLYESGMMVQQIADMSEISYSTVWRRLKSKGKLRGKKESIRLSVERGTFAKNRIGMKRPPISEETRKRMSDAQKGKGKGFKINTNGYVEITRGENAGRFEHVLIMESLIGRKLYHNECVHHKNHIKTDNRIENLELMTKSEHASYHAKHNQPNRQRNDKGMFI